MPAPSHRDKRHRPSRLASGFPCDVMCRWTPSCASRVLPQLASDMQLETDPDLSVVGGRTFVGEPSALAAAANAALTQLASRPPIATVWAADVTSLGVKAASAASESRALRSSPLRLAPPLDQQYSLLELELPGSLGMAGSGSGGGDSPSMATGARATDLWAPSASGVTLRADELAAPPANAWVPLGWSGAASATMVRQVTRRAFNGFEGGGGVDVGFGVLQLPSCTDQRTLRRISGSRAALADVVGVACGNSAEGTPSPYATRPLAVAILQITTPVPAAASPRQAARAELWRLTLLQTLSETLSAASRAGLQADISYNTRGLRLLCSGYAPELPRLMSTLVRRTLRHTPPPAGSLELNAARQVAVQQASRRASRNALGQRAPVVEAELLRATPEQLQSEVTRLFQATQNASLLLAGALSREGAESLERDVRRELEPLLPPARRAANGVATPLAAVSFDDELASWAGLLYRPAFASLSLNACIDPALSRTLDQCGSR